MPTLNRGFALTWLGHSTFRLVTRGAKTVLMDPWVEGNPAAPGQKQFGRSTYVDLRSWRPWATP
jgi:L-ascorbate metabolism protein UlaG (beta-lactamase superfamily)